MPLRVSLRGGRCWKGGMAAVGRGAVLAVVSVAELLAAYSCSNSFRMFLYLVATKSRRAFSFLFSSFVFCLFFRDRSFSRCTYVDFCIVNLIGKTCANLPERAERKLSFLKFC